jgi:hypothetical protein
MHAPQACSAKLQILQRNERKLIIIYVYAIFFWCVYVHALNTQILFLKGTYILIPLTTIKLNNFFPT